MEEYWQQLHPPAAPQPTPAEASSSSWYKLVWLSTSGVLFSWIDLSIVSWKLVLKSWLSERDLYLLGLRLCHVFPLITRKKKKMQCVCSILEIRLVWLNCGWCANSPKLSSDSVNLICRYHWSSHERKKKSREGKRDRHVLHKKLYFQNSVSSPSVEHITLLEAEHILLFHHQDYKHQC